MQNHVKTYKIVLTTVGPVHIGSGSSYGKKDTIFDWEDNKVYIPNLNLMYKYFIENDKVDAYQKFLLDTKGDFTNWLEYTYVSKNEYMKWCNYSLDAADVELEAHSKKEIASFVKDAYFKPYVPGSSLKGVLRTVLLTKGILKNKHRFYGIAQAVKQAQCRNKNRYLGDEMRKLEGAIFRTRKLEDIDINNALNDILAGVRISDSSPLLVNDLVLCQKMDVTRDGQISKLNILRECIKPGTEIEFTLTIDTSITDITKEEILEAINIFLESYNESFDSKFIDGDNFTKDIIYLGAGSGFVSKTVLYPLLGVDAVKEVSSIINNTIPVKLKNKHDHEDDQYVGVSPHMIKKTSYNGSLISMGTCSIKIY